MLSTIRRLASKLLKVGESRIKFKDKDREKISKALTRDDVRNLIKDKSVYVIGKVKKGKRVRKKKRAKGPGKKRGTRNARKSDKEKWMERVRAQRKLLKELIQTGKIDKKYRRKIYLKIKGGSFRGKRAMISYLKENGFYKE